MAPDDRNRFLDADESEDDASQGYDSEEELQKGGRSAKRRKIRDGGSDDESASDAEDDISDDEAAVSAKKPAGDRQDKQDKQKQKQKAKQKDQDSEAAEPANEADSEDRKTSKPPSAKLPSLSKPVGKQNLVVSEAAIRRSGVVYLSRIPPFMKPAKLRSLLEPYGRINRAFLSPEDPAAHARRVRAGGNRKRLHTDGWVEFVDKRDAKEACALLNARPIGGKKGSFYRDDVWSLLYLKGFKWHHLTEQIAAENAERESRMRAEIGRTARENKEFVRNVERAKMLDGMESKRAAKKNKRKRGEGAEGVDEERPVVEGDGAADGSEKKRSFKQIPLAKKRAVEAQPEHVTRVLSKIF